MPLDPGHLRVVRTFTGRSDTSMRGNFQMDTSHRCVALSLERRLLLPLVLAVPPHPEPSRCYCRCPVSGRYSAAISSLLT